MPYNEKDLKIRNLEAELVASGMAPPDYWEMEALKDRNQELEADNEEFFNRSLIRGNKLIRIKEVLVSGMPNDEVVAIIRDVMGLTCHNEFFV